MPSSGRGGPGGRCQRQTRAQGSRAACARACLSEPRVGGNSGFARSLPRARKVNFACSLSEGKIGFRVWVGWGSSCCCSEKLPPPHSPAPEGRGIWLRAGKAKWVFKEFGATCERGAVAKLHLFGSRRRALDARMEKKSMDHYLRRLKQELVRNAWRKKGWGLQAALGVARSELHKCGQLRTRASLTLSLRFAAAQPGPCFTAAFPSFPFFLLPAPFPAPGFVESLPRAFP